MKFSIEKSLLVVFFIILCTISIIKSENLPNNELTKNKFIQCKICQYSFKFNFNYDKLLEDSSSTSSIKRFFVNSIDNEELENIFKKDNIENLSKEVSMQFFFKGSENQFVGQNLIDYTDCKENKKEKSFCDDLKLKLCDEILGSEKICLNISNLLKQNNKNIKIDEIKKLQNSKNLPSNSDQKNKSFLQSNILTNTLPQNTNLMDMLKNLKQLNFKQKSGEKQPHINNLSKSFLNKNSKNNQETREFAKSNMNFLQLTPEYINRNLNSKQKSHWKPPKPVLLKNFESSVTDQLKDIGFLTTYII